MRVVVHQPHFLPWEPYFARLARADLFVVLDDVVFKKGYFHNRTVISDGSGGGRLLTLPVKKSNQVTISKVELVGTHENRKCAYSIANAYLRFKELRNFVDEICSKVESAPDLLMPLNMELINSVFNVLGITPPEIAYASAIALSQERTARLIDICHRTGATTMLVGWGAMLTTHDLTAIRAAGIVIEAQDRELSLEGIGNFPEGMSVIESICREGPQITADRIVRKVQAFRSVEQPA